MKNTDGADKSLWKQEKKEKFKKIAVERIMKCYGHWKLLCFGRCV